MDGYAGIVEVVGNVGAGLRQAQQISVADVSGSAAFEAIDEPGDFEIGVGLPRGVQDRLAQWSPLSRRGECGDHGRPHDEEGWERLQGHESLCKESEGKGRAFLVVFSSLFSFPLLLWFGDRFWAMGAEKRLLELGIVLPEPASAGGNYVPAKTVGDLVYLSGVISTGPDGVVTGSMESSSSIEKGYAAARLCGLAQLAAIRKHVGSLDEVAEVVSVNGYVNAQQGFADSPKVINGCSDLLVEVFGETGRHVRAAVGVSALPRNALVEVQMVVRIG